MKKADRKPINNLILVKLSDIDQIINLHRKVVILLKTYGTKEIKCSVDNCSYNKSHMCNADSIEVNTMGDGKAETADGTCCSTFTQNE